MFDELQNTLMQIVGSIAWGQWLAAGFLLLLGIVLGTLVARSAGKLAENRISRHHQVMIRRLVFYLVFIIFAMAALRE
ncbi:MAG: MscS mechanosensitive ion channel, partial [Marinobacter sp. T13-3]